MMKLLKNIAAIFLVTICFLLSACTPDDALSDAQSNEQSVHVGSTNLKSVVCNENFDNSNIEIGVHSDEIYYFNNHNQDFLKAFLNFLENTEIKPTTNYDSDACYIYINVYNSNNSVQNFSVNEYDQVQLFENATEIVYKSEGIYETLTTWINPFLKNNENFCRVASTSIHHMYEYVVYDKDYNVIRSDYISRQPHIFLNDSNIIHLWVQTGTGCLSRWAQFFNGNNGTQSPVYYGQTDSFGELVVAAESGQVSVYDMFSGDLLYRIDEFDKPIADYIENIISAYFSKDGTKIIIRYRTNDAKEESQVVDLPKNLITNKANKNL